MAIDQNISAYKIFLIKERIIKVTNQVTFDEDYFPMKAAAISKSPQVAEEPITTEDSFPPEDGRYMVSFDLHLLGLSLRSPTATTQENYYIIVFHMTFHAVRSLPTVSNIIK